MTFELPGASRLTGLTLRVRDIEKSSAFYRDLFGLEETRDGSAIAFTPANGGFELRLEQDPAAPVRPYPSVGLYHYALLLPDRLALARMLRRLVEAGWQLEGAADHGVSEALYLRDPEYNGIELYRDRPMETWDFTPNGEVAMVTEPLDLQGLVDEADRSTGIDPATTLGHMHLHVADLARAEALYTSILGMNMRSRFIPSARFLAAGSYHHHLGINTWARGQLAPAEATGLLSYSWGVPTGTLGPLAEHLRASDSDYRHSEDGIEITDATSGGVQISLSEE